MNQLFFSFLLLWVTPWRRGYSHGTVGPVTVVRRDGGSFGGKDMGIIHEYMCGLIDIFGVPDYPAARATMNVASFQKMCREYEHCDYLGERGGGGEVVGDEGQGRAHTDNERILVVSFLSFFSVSQLTPQHRCNIYSAPSVGETLMKKLTE